jgi:hypothetical protein
MVGVGLRLVQDVGRHRKRLYSNTDLAESEHWRRAFWVLVVLDRLMSASFGRPCAIQEEEYVRSILLSFLNFTIVCQLRR